MPQATGHKIKNIPICLVVVAAAILSQTGALAVEQKWQEAGSEHFIVYFFDNEKFAKEVLDKAEIYYKDIAVFLGYPRYSEFWIWDNRAKIHIYKKHQDYIKATGAPEWTQGLANYKARSISSYAWSKGFTDSLLPHEMAHLIFRDFVGFKGEIPLWLDEGVAQWAEAAKRNQMKKMAKDYYMSDKLLLLTDMMKLNINNIKDDNKIYLSIRRTLTTDNKEAVLIITLDELINTYYLQGFSLAGFLIERYDSTDFAHFCRQLRDGKSLEEALRFAYPTAFRSLNELELRWRKYLEDEKV